MKDDRMIASLDTISLPMDREEALLQRILQNADAERTSMEAEQKMDARKTAARMLRKRNRNQRGQRDLRANLKWLIPVAAVLVVLITLFSIPSVSQAIQGWFNDLFRVERYMRTGRDGAQKDPDMEQAIQQIDPFGQSYEIRLLHEIPATEHYSYASIDQWRMKQGQPAFSEADWNWIRDMTPEVKEVLYDGKHLIINLFYETDPVPFAYGYLTGVKPGVTACDIMCLDYTLTIDGVDMPVYSYGHGLDFSKWYPRSQEPGFALEEVRADGGVHAQVTTDFPISPALPDGICQAELIMTVQDAQTDDMGIIGMVAQITHRFSFDTAAGNAQVKSSAAENCAFFGTGTVTVFHYGDLLEDASDDDESRTYDVRGNRIATDGEQWVENRTVELRGLTVTPIVNKRTTGMHVELPYVCPDDWDYDLQNAVMSSISYELILDGVSQGMLDRSGAGVSPMLEISLTESEQANAKSIVLRPYLTHYAAWDVGVPMRIGTRLDLQEYGNGVTDPEIESVLLPGCDITIPLN